MENKIIEVYFGIYPWELRQLDLKSDIEDNTSIEDNSSVDLQFPENERHPIVLRQYLETYIFDSGIEKITIITLSDFLFSYLRRLIAEEELNVNNVKFYWVEGEGDKRIITNIIVNEFGSCHEFPREMYQEILESEKILNASLRKREKSKRSSDWDQLLKENVL